MRMQEYIRSFGWPEDTDETEFHRATIDDAPALNDLFNRVFKQERSVEHYLWKAWQVPSGPPVVAYARDKESGLIVAAMTGIRRAAWMDGKPVEALQTCETCSDEKVRGGGKVFSGAVKGGMATACEVEHIWFAYGGQSNRAARVVGGRWFGYVTAFTLIPHELRLSVVPALVSRMGPLGKLVGRVADFAIRRTWKKRDHGYQIREVTSFGPEFDQMWEKHRDKFRLTIARDSVNLNWRYIQNPAWKHRILVASRDGEPCGYIIWRPWAPDGVQVATVLDLWDGDDPDLAEALLDGLRRVAHKDCAFLQFSVMEKRNQKVAMNRFRSCRVSPHLEPDHVQVGWTQGATPGTLQRAAVEMLDIFITEDCWYYTQGDCDFRD